MSEKISPIAAGIIEGLQEALLDAQGVSVPGLRKTVGRVSKSAILR